MKLIFIRHGDPDYVNDTLTEKGKEEAKALSDYIRNLEPTYIYQSPLGRAQDTAEYSLDKLGMQAETKDWLREFSAEFDPNKSETARQAFKTELSVNSETGAYNKRIIWDILPDYLGKHPELLGEKTWQNSEVVASSDMIEKYEYVIRSFDELLAQHGYERDGLIYRVKENNSDTIIFFCHFGVTSVLLSHMMNISPFVLLQFMASAPTSVTELASEEREKGIAIFRMLRFGDTTHLSIQGQMPSFSARFCERYDNMDERH